MSANQENLMNNNEITPSAKLDNKIQNNINKELPKFNTYDQISQFAKILANTTMIPKDYQNKPNDIFVAICMGLELGLTPLASLRGISVINGRPTLWGDAMVSLIKTSGLCEYIKNEIDETDANNIIAICKTKRKNEDEVVYKFSQKDAVKAGLWSKNVWAAYPKRMLQNRARAFCLRDVYPDVLNGMHDKEEAEDIAVENTQKNHNFNENVFDSVAITDDTIKINENDNSINNLI